MLASLEVDNKPYYISNTKWQVTQTQTGVELYSVYTLIQQKTMTEKRR